PYTTLFRSTEARYKNDRLITRLDHRSFFIFGNKSNKKRNATRRRKRAHFQRSGKGTEQQGIYDPSAGQDKTLGRFLCNRGSAGAGFCRCLFRWHEDRGPTHFRQAQSQDPGGGTRKAAFLAISSPACRNMESTARHGGRGNQPNR